MLSYNHFSCLSHHHKSQEISPSRRRKLGYTTMDYQKNKYTQHQQHKMYIHHSQLNSRHHKLHQALFKSHLRIQYCIKRLKLEILWYIETLGDSLSKLGCTPLSCWTHHHMFQVASSFRLHKLGYTLKVLKSIDSLFQFSRD